MRDLKLVCSAIGRARQPFDRPATLQLKPIPIQVDCIKGYLAVSFLMISSSALAQVSVITSQFNNSRTAANLNETVLNGSNVNVFSFGKRSTFPVNGQVYAQPLYAAGLTIAGSRTDVLYVATMTNDIYAFDARNAARGFLAHRTLVASVPSNYAGTCPDPAYTGPQLGILSTPVADLTTNTLYVVAATPNPPNTYKHQLCALDMLTLADRHAPVTISASVVGRAPDAQGGIVSLNQITQIQRPGLVLANGTVYAAFGGCGPDPEPYHGWLIGYNATTLQQTAVFNTSPNGRENAIWQSGRAPVSDVGGSLYFFTGNVDHNTNGGISLSNSVLKLSPAGTLLDWFTPSNFDLFDRFDLDLSSSGPILMPDSNRLVGGGKFGEMYVLDPNSLGKNTPPLQTFQATSICSAPTDSGCYQIHSTAYWSSSTPTLYVWGVNDTLRAYRASGGVFNTTPASQAAQTATFPGGNLAVSSNGSQPGTGIVWATTPPGVLHAYDATNVARELWSSEMNGSRDRLGDLSKFGQPVIANGQVFVPTFSNTVVAYGLLAPSLPVSADFDGDRKSNVSVWRPSNGYWYIQRPAGGSDFYGFPFGKQDDVPVPADYDGDGITDSAVYRPSNGTWYLLQSRDGFQTVVFGTSGDIPVARDYDGDGKADIAVFRPSNGTWYLQQSRDGFKALQFGATGDIPAVGDYDGDGKADIAVFRPSNGLFYILGSTRGFYTTQTTQLGQLGDIPVPGDYDGDLKTDIALWRPSNGTWYYLQSSDGASKAVQLGQLDDVPVPGDYDGDTKTDFAVFRPSNQTWYLRHSADNSLHLEYFGESSDKPLPGH